MIGDETVQWVANARRGDDESFACLVEAHQKPVFNLCYRMLGDPQEAEDAAQETFLRAYRFLQKYDPSRSFLTWLLSIASHYCIDQLRKRKMTFISVDREEEDGWAEIELQDTSPGPEAILRESEERRQVRALLKGLDPIDRAAIIFLYWYEYSYEEIAEVLDLSVSAVKSRLHRARREMAKAWAFQEETRKEQQTTLFSVKPSNREGKRYGMPVF